MMKFLASIATMSAMLLHSIIGCCGHHVHACEHEHVAVDCSSGQDEQPSGSCGRESLHQEHHHAVQGESDGSRSGRNCECDPHDRRPVDESNHESHEHPHGPCELGCSDGACSFTPSSKVKTPAPADAGSWNASTTAHQPAPEALPTVCGKSSSESVWFRISAAACGRTTTQVWRL